MDKGASVPDRAFAPTASSQPEAVSPVPASIPSAVWTGSKRQREALRAKFGGRCAYCGGELGKSMHADHLEPCIRIKPNPWNELDKTVMHKPERNTVANMMPACAPCNLHKGGYSLEAWRTYLQRSAEIVAKQTSTFRAGERFGVIIVNNAPVRFYFEKIAGQCEECADGIWPMYGVAPHECFWRKGPEYTLGQSTLVPITADDCFVPELEDGETWADFRYPQACGVYYCPDCQSDEYQRAWDALIARVGLPPASAMSARSAETEGLSPQDASAVTEGQTP